jgi:hypothetical protein
MKNTLSSHSNKPKQVAIKYYSSFSLSLSLSRKAKKRKKKRKKKPISFLIFLSYII